MVARTATGGLVQTIRFGTSIDAGGDRTRMLGWLKNKLPGAKAFVLAKAVKGMDAEWGGGP